MSDETFLQRVGEFCALIRHDPTITSFDELLQLMIMTTTGCATYANTVGLTSAEGERLLRKVLEDRMAYEADVAIAGGVVQAPTVSLLADSLMAAIHRLKVTMETSVPEVQEEPDGDAELVSAKVGRALAYVARNHHCYFDDNYQALPPDDVVADMRDQEYEPPGSESVRKEATPTGSASDGKVVTTERPPLPELLNYCLRGKTDHDEIAHITLLYAQSLASSNMQGRGSTVSQKSTSLMKHLNAFTANLQTMAMLQSLGSLHFSCIWLLKMITILLPKLLHTYVVML